MAKILSGLDKPFRRIREFINPSEKQARLAREARSPSTVQYNNAKSAATDTSRFAPKQPQIPNRTVTENADYKPNRIRGNPNKYNVNVEGKNYPTNNPDFVPSANANPGETITYNRVGHETDVSVRGGESVRLTDQELKGFNGEPGGIITDRVKGLIDQRNATFGVAETKRREDIISNLGNVPQAPEVQPPSALDQLGGAVPDVLNKVIPSAIATGGAFLATGGNAPVASAVGVGSLGASFFGEMIQNQNEEIKALGYEMQSYDDQIRNTVTDVNKGYISPEDAMMQYNDVLIKLNEKEAELRSLSKTLTGKKLLGAQRQLSIINRYRAEFSQHSYFALVQAIRRPDQNYIPEPSTQQAQDYLQ